MSGLKLPPEIAELTLELLHNQMKQIRATLRKEVELIETEKRERRRTKDITSNHTQGVSTKDS